MTWLVSLLLVAAAFTYAYLRAGEVIANARYAALADLNVDEPIPYQLVQW